MKYQILLVDDEPIILSGIKFLIDWEKNDCEIIGTARNGKSAMEAIESLRPHIVICDINMPVISGLDVLKYASENSNLPVFIMLTNYGEFNLAREALRYKAIDYLLKSQLDEESLEKSLSNAKEEYERRRGLMKVDLATQYLQGNRNKIVAQSLLKIIYSYPSCMKESIEDLISNNVLNNYCFIHLFLDYRALPNFENLSDKEFSQLFSWEQEVVEKLAGNTFQHYTILDLYNNKQSLLLFCYHTLNYSNALIEHFYTKLCNASHNITQIQLSLTTTDMFADASSILDGIGQLLQLAEHNYNFGDNILLFHQLSNIDFYDLSLKHITNKLVQAIRTSNRSQCELLMNLAIEEVTLHPHKRQTAINECTSLYSTTASILEPMLPEHQHNDYFQNSTINILAISKLISRRNVLNWLENHKKNIIRQLEQLTSSKSQLAEKARNYVIQNIDQRIMLQDVAEYVNLTPNYLSALFKKTFNCNFVDFINEVKMERACTLIHEGKYKIYEISFMLGYDNPYYFTKVFKKQMGLTPTEYQRKKDV